MVPHHHPVRAAVARVAVLVTVLTLLALGGCAAPETSGLAPDDPIVGTPIAPTGPVWTVAKPSWTAPAVVGGVIVMGVVDKGEPTLVALHPDDGRQLWARQMSPSYVLRGIAMSFRVRGDVVEFLEAVPGTLLARVTSVRAATGQVLGQTPWDNFRSYPYACDHDKSQTCVEYRDGQVAQLSPDRRSLKAQPKPTGVDGMQSIASHGLVVTFDGRIGVVDGGRLRWSTPESNLFGNEYSVNSGWSFHHLDKPAMFVGSVGRGAFTPRSPRDLDIDMVTVGFDARTGKVAWRRVGVGAWCLGGQRATLAAQLYLGCGERGTATYDDKGRRTAWRDPAHVIEALDPATGMLKWNLTWRGWGLAKPEEPEHAVVDDWTILARGPEPMVVDLRAGPVRPAGPNDLGWCQGAHATLTSKVTWDDRNELYGDQPYRPCTGSGDTDRAPQLIPAKVGARVGTLVVVPYRDKVVAFRRD